MNVVIDDNSGFCFGVVYAIQLAEDELDAGNQLYCLGDIVHNDLEVERLRRKGLQIIDHDELKNLRDCKVLIRAHGEPPATYQLAIENNITLIDASCPVVLKLQHRVRTAHHRNLEGEADAQIVIYGKPGHAEVNGLIGQTADQAIIILGEDDLERIDFTRPIYMFSQTTKSTDSFYRLKDLVIERAAAVGNDRVEANDTICRQVSNREPQLLRFAEEHDVIVFVAGKKSSNGKVLFNVCKSKNSHSHFISHPDELKPEWLSEAKSVGICGATSTPMWLMKEVAERIRESARLASAV